MTDKLQHFVSGKLETFHHANTFAREKTSGPERLRVGPRGGQRYLFEQLAACVGPPHKLLYVLHTTRTDAELGRYESPWLESGELSAFLNRFGDFVSQDSRHDLWVLCDAGGGTIVWDRHDLMYAYGPLERYTMLLESGGFREGWPTIPASHAHLYNAEWDDAERALLAHYEWRRTKLRPDDLQTREPEA
ncbi:MAG TPA: hypothetical protein VGH98_04465 [Gemmatimonadaceae bacterium]